MPPLPISVTISYGPTRIPGAKLTGPAWGKARLYRVFERLAQQGEIPLPGDFSRPERGQVLGTPLDVEQGEARFTHRLDEKHQRDLRRVALCVKHRFTREQAVDAHAVQTAGQLPGPIEHLYAVRPAQLVEPLVRGDELRCDPSALALGVGAGANDVGEAGVDADVIALRALPQRARDAQRVEREDAARIGRPPGEERLRRLDDHREDALPVRRDHGRGL